MNSQKPLGPVRAPQTHFQGAALDHSTLGAPQSYPPPGHPTAGAPQAYNPVTRAPQLYPTPSSGTQANSGASPQEYPPSGKNNAVGTGAPQSYPSPPPSSLSSPQDYTSPPIAISAAYETLPPPPPPKKTSFPSSSSSSSYFPSVSDSKQQPTPTIYNLPVVNTPLSPPTHHTGYAAQSIPYPSPGASHTTPTTNSTPQVHHQTPVQQHTPVQQQQHLPVQQQQRIPTQQQQHTPTQQQQQHVPTQQQYTHHVPVQQLFQQQPTNLYTANAHSIAPPVRQSTIYNPQPHPSTHQSHQPPVYSNIQPPPSYTPTTSYGVAPHPVPTTAAQHYPQRPPPQQGIAQPMLCPVQQKPAAAPSSFHAPPLARVCCITFNEQNKIRLIGANPETVPPLRHAITNCGAGLEEDTPVRSDGHEFRLSTRPWRTKEKESIPSRLLLLAVLKAMAHCRWNIVQAARISKIDNDRDFLMFESIDPALGAVEMAEVDMFVMTLMGKEKIRVIGAGPSTTAVVGVIKQAILTHWKHPIKKDVVEESYHEFQLEGNPWAPQKAEEAAAKICMAQLLANVSSLGYKLYVSLDIHKSSKDSESECLVFRRVGRVWR